MGFDWAFKGLLSKWTILYPWKVFSYTAAKDRKADRKCSECSELVVQGTLCGGHQTKCDIWKEQSY